MCEPKLNLEGLAKLDAEIERLERSRIEVEERDGFPLPHLIWKPDAYRQAREWLVKEGENGE